MRPQFHFPSLPHRENGLGDSDPDSIEGVGISLYALGSDAEPKARGEGR